MRQRIAPMMLPAARALVRRHLDAGDLCAIITATNSFVTAPDRARVRHRAPHRHRAGATRRPLHGAGRRACPASARARCARLDDWLAGLGRRFADFAESACYSDSHNDLPLLERVRGRWPWTPTRPSPREAARRGWAAHLPPVESAALNDQAVHPARARPALRNDRCGCRARSTASPRERLSPAAAKVCAVLREARLCEPTWSAARCATSCSASSPRTSTSPPTRARSRSSRCSAARIIIGRRFRLVHVMLGPETVEVSTFRAADADTSEKDEHGRVLRDNVFGTAGRRRAAARLHRQRAVLRPRDRGSRRLPRRPRRPEEARDAHDRRPGDALSRGSGPHAARGAGWGPSSA